MYQSLIKPILFHFNPESVHNTLVRTGEFLGSNIIGRSIVSSFYDYTGPDISRKVDGIYYRTPVVLSAGFDYNAHLSQILPSIGFGGEEIGSVTALPCRGNPTPRLFRLPQNQSLIVNKGLANDGVEAIIKRLKNKKRIGNFVTGISIARTNCPASCVSTSAGIEDYNKTISRLTEEDVGDYYTINISCPNAYGGESFTHPERLEKLLDRIVEHKDSRPIYVKMPINMNWDEFKELLNVIKNHNVQGVIIGNLNKNYNELRFRQEAPKEYRGGLSGSPTWHRSNELIKRTKNLYGDKMTVIGSGGILSPEDAVEKLKMGADLIQLITGMIYKGPGLIKKICNAVAEAKV